jgi:2-polyprenyl-3-methyl-5-hydroxy-6-metoxy-1,4-benzoquinol methylase
MVPPRKLGYHRLRVEVHLSRPLSLYDEEYLEASREVIAEKRRFVESRNLRAQRILDLGCGTGILEGVSAANELHGVDVDRALLERARGRGYHVHAVDLSAGVLPFASSSFDVVVTFDVLEHVAAPVSLLAEVARVLRPEGCLFVSVPNSVNVLNRILFLCGDARDVTDRHHQLGLPLSDHLHRMTRRDSVALLTEQGFRIVEQGCYVPRTTQHRWLRGLEPLLRLVRGAGLERRFPDLLAFGFFFLCVRESASEGGR